MKSGALGPLVLGLLLSLQVCPAEAKFRVSPKISAPDQPPIVLQQERPKVVLPVEHTEEEPAAEATPGNAAAKPLPPATPRRFLRAVRPEPNPALPVTSQHQTPEAHAATRNPEAARPAGKPVVDLPGTSPAPARQKQETPQRLVLSATPAPSVAPVRELPLLGGHSLTPPAVYRELLERLEVIVQDAAVRTVEEDDAQPVPPAAPVSLRETAGQAPLKNFPEPGEAAPIQGQQLAAAEPVAEKALLGERELQALEHYRRGNEYGRSGRAKKALQEYEQALALNPALKDGYVGMAAAYGARNRWKEARKALYLALDGTGQFHFHNSPIQAHYNLAVAECELGNREDSLAEYRLVKQARHPNAENLLEYIEKNCRP